MTHPQGPHGELFDFERLIVYQRILALVRLLAPLLDRPPRRAAKACEDLDRALQSMAFNVPEGCGRKDGSPDRKRFFGFALGSAKEAASQVIFLHIRGHMRGNLYPESRKMLLEVVRMLTKMAA
jgi:four helix bundle protein